MKFEGVGANATYSPEVVHNQVENAENDNEQDSAKLGLEADNNHDTSSGSNNGEGRAPDRPLAAKDEADKEEDEQDTARELEVHFPVLLIDLGESRKGLVLPNPGVGEHHEETAHHGEVAQEEVKVGNEAIAEGLGHNDNHKAADSVVGVFPDDDEGRANSHGEDVEQQEEVRDARGDCNEAEA